MKAPDFTPRGRNATSSVNEGPRQPGGDAKYGENFDRAFGKRKSTPGYTIIRYVNGKRIEVRGCEVKSRSEVGLKPLKVESI